MRRRRNNKRIIPGGPKTQEKPLSLTPRPFKFNINRRILSWIWIRKETRTSVRSNRRNYTLTTLLPTTHNVVPRLRERNRNRTGPTEILSRTYAYVLACPSTTCPTPNSYFPTSETQVDVGIWIQIPKSKVDIGITFPLSHFPTQPLKFPGGFLFFCGEYVYVLALEMEKYCRNLGVKMKKWCWCWCLDKTANFHPRFPPQNPRCRVRILSSKHKSTSYKWAWR